MTAPGLNAPIFVLSGARSGSTLLRNALAVHPELLCPSEPNVATALEALQAAWRQVRGQTPSPEEEASALRRPIEAMMAAALATSGRTRWVDKSLVNAAAAPLLRRVWPEARFICLYRHAMDFITSALDACPWGLSGYGFERYASLFPSNSVLALAHYWIDITGSMRTFEDTNPDVCAAVRYEDLVADFDGVISEVYGFLGLPASPQAPYPGAHAGAWAEGPGDHKIWFRTGVDGSSLGAGLRVPVQLVPPEPLSTINELLQDLGYQTLDETWGSCGRAPTRRPSPGELEKGCLRVRVLITAEGRSMAEREVLVEADKVLCLATDDAGAGPVLTVVLDEGARRQLLAGTNLGLLLRRREVRAYGAGLPGEVLHGVTKAVGSWLASEEASLGSV